MILAGSIHSSHGGHDMHAIHRFEFCDISSDSMFVVFLSLYLTNLCATACISQWLGLISGGTVHKNVPGLVTEMFPDMFPESPPELTLEMIPEIFPKALPEILLGDSKIHHKDYC